MKNIVAFIWVLLLGAAFAGPASAAEKPFAENKIVLQISDSDPFKQTLVLNVANNLVKEYGADNVDIQVVAFGPGVRLLFADNANNGRIKSLVENSGVEFHACSNTLRNMTKKLGEAPVINPLASKDSPGIVRISRLSNSGYLLVKP
jgi:intracellular sulfur oxidation DsrE/DsrF family protein